MWINPTAEMGFKYFGKRSPQINREWIEELMLSANSVTGLHISPEPNGPSQPHNGHNGQPQNGQ